MKTLLASFLLFCPNVALAAIAHVQSATNDSGGYTTSASVAFGSNNTAGNTIVVFTSSDSAPPTGVSDTQGNSYTKIGDGSAQYTHGSMWYSDNVNAGANTVTATYAGNNDSTIIAREFSGLANPSFDDYREDVETSYSQNHVVSGFVPAVNDTIYVSGFAMDSNEESTVVVGQSFIGLVAKDGSDLYNSGASAYKIVSDGSATNATFQTSAYVKGYVISAGFSGDSGGTPTPTPTPTATPCPGGEGTSTFETDFDYWENSAADDYDWTRDSGGTPSGSTGPSSGDSSTWYIYVETSSGQGAFVNGDENIIENDFCDTQSGTVDFAYHQYGANQGTLSLDAYNGSSWDNIWSSTGDQGNQWNSVTDQTFLSAEMLRFRNVAAGGYQGDVALDNIVVTYGAVNSAPTIAANTADEEPFGTSTPTVEFTGSDTDNDDIRYNVQILEEADGYDFSNRNSGTAMDTLDWWGQNFYGNGEEIASVQFNMDRIGSPTGVVRAHIFASTGTYGSSSTPTGSALATSAEMNASDLPTSNAVVEFKFEDAQQITLTDSVVYFAVVEWSGTGDSSNRPGVGIDSTSPADAGNPAYSSSGSSWTAYATWDLPFAVYTVALDKTSGTDAGFTNTTDGGDTDPFDAGDKVSFTVQGGDALADGTYHWHARARDPSGSDSWSSYTDERSFTVTDAGETFVPKIIFSFFDSYARKFRTS